MKKLLTLLAATGLVASSSISVVACGKKPGVSTDDSILTTKILIDEFINEIGSRIYTHIQSEKIHTNLTREITPSVPVTDFFSKENIQKYGVNTDNLEGTVSPLGEAENTRIKDSFNNLVEITTLATNINKLATETDKYSILINGGVVVKDIVFDTSSFTMSYVNRDKFLATASIRMAVNFTYLDYNQTVVSGNASNGINLRVTDSSEIQIGITNLENNLANDLINVDSEAAWFNATDLNYAQKDLYQAFELYNDQRRTNKLNEHFTKEGWQTTINSFISEKNYFENSSNTTVKLDVSEKQIKSDKLLSKIEPISYVSDPEYYGDNLDFRKTILQNFDANDNLNFASGSSKGNKVIYDGLNAKFKDAYLNFKTDTLSKLTNYSGTKLNNDNILLGEVVLTGLTLNFEELDFSLPINPLNFSYSISLTNSVIDVETNSTLDKSALGEAVYKNTEAGIKSFQDNFGTSDSNDDKYLISSRSKFDTDGNLTDTWRIEKIRLPMVFSGKSKSQPTLNVNIFDELPEIIELYTEAGILNANSTLSLETNNLSAVRYNLLRAGYQGNFAFKFASTRSMVIDGVRSRIQIPITTEIGRWRFYREDDFYRMRGAGTAGGAIKNQVGISVAFQLDFNLISIFIGLPETMYHLVNNDPDKKYEYYSGAFSNLFAKI